MKLTSNIIVSALLAVLPFGLCAQTATSPDWGPKAGDHEFTLGGAGASNRQFSASLGGANLAYGYYFNPAQELSVRQSINYSNPDTPGARQEWNGATRIAFDQHLLSTGIIRPFVGVNFGGVYGRSVQDTWAAGLEAGLKYYVHPQTFIYAVPEYDWFFRHARGINHSFNDGQFNWSLGVGFNF
jgi:hypothetical protein